MENYYFKMKVGSGNRMLYASFAMANLDSMSAKNAIDAEDYIKIGDQLYLYVGYATDCEHLIKFEDDHFVFEKEGTSCCDIPNKDNGKKPHPTDLLWLAVAHKFEIKILVYGRKYLFCFQATGDLQGLTPQEITKINNNQDLLSNIIKDFFKKENLAENLEIYKNAAFLPVQLIGKIERKQLPAVIDSLSVYQYLNQGTFRPVYAINPAAKFKRDFEKKLKRLDINIVCNKEQKTYQARLNYLDKFETPYSVVIRKIYDALFFKVKSSEEMISDELICTLLSPSQLEAAAGYFLFDLGFIPDFFRGGALDHVDIRGRKSKAREAKSHLVKIFNQIIPKVKIEEKDIIEIQCKDYNSPNLSLDDLIYLTPTFTDENKNKIGLSDIILKIKLNKIADSVLLEWFEKQKDLINGIFR